jgi:hypothetical protein
MLENVGPIGAKKLGAMRTACSAPSARGFSHRVGVFNGLAARSPLTNGASRKHFAMRSPPCAGIAQSHEPTPR